LGQEDLYIDIWDNGNEIWGKLNNIKTHITAVRGALDDLADFVNTEFPGLNE
jgi:hypothetical protein